MKTTLGWREWLALPELGIPAIKAKIDTGAKTSALHAFFVEPFDKQGQTYVRFGLHPLQRRTSPEMICEAPLKEQRIVSDSGGHREQRYVIETMVALAGHSWPIEITLTDRESMRFRMLLGRSALGDDFLIVPQSSFLTGRELRTSYRNKGTQP
ncbi:MAG: ATP-dependent zinc protease [Desulfuromonas sp.]|nr:MAG: ATP-dependent zinc protease [Desulfuromonas sp.]